MVYLNMKGRFPFEIFIGDVCHLMKKRDAEKLLEELRKAIEEYDQTVADREEVIIQIRKK